MFEMIRVMCVYGMLATVQGACLFIGFVHGVSLTLYVSVTVLLA